MKVVDSFLPPPSLLDPLSNLHILFVFKPHFGNCSTLFHLESFSPIQTWDSRFQKNAWMWNSPTYLVCITSDFEQQNNGTLPLKPRRQLWPVVNVNSVCLWPMNCGDCWFRSIKHECEEGKLPPLAKIDPGWWMLWNCSWCCGRSVRVDALMVISSHERSKTLSVMSAGENWILLGGQAVWSWKI